MIMQTQYRKHSLSHEAITLLEANHIVWNPSTMSIKPMVTRLAEMLSIYGLIHGNTIIPQTFIVPSNSHDWPSHFHGAKVGYSLANMRTRYRKNTLSSDAILLLEAHKIVWNINQNQLAT